MSSADLSTLARRHRAYAATHSAPSFAVQFRSGPPSVFGDGEPEFTIVALDEAGEKALSSMDQFQVAVAYLEGHLDVEGDMQSALSIRGLFNDFHPITWLSKFVPSLVGLGARHDRQSISAHYDRDSDFFLTFLDTKHRCYTQGAFVSDDEPLEPAMTRKMDIALQSLGVGPGDHVLEVGGGWGAFLEYAAKQGIRVTSLTLSKESESYLNALIDREGLSTATVVRQHLLQYRTNERYDAIVNMGTTEHLPDYRATLRKYREVLKPGGTVYLDALAMRSKLRLSTFFTRYIYPGSSAPLVLHDYLAKVARSPFVVTDVHDERHNYYLTCRAWAQRLDAARDEIERRWGTDLYRRFRIFLWGSAAAFDSNQVQAYRWLLRLP
jgi:cyclopropane-fatty-acyl-phospholipid synthase